MALTYPTFEQLAAQIQAEFKTQLPTVDPTVFGSWAFSFANGNAVLAQAIMFIVRDLEKQLFPTTATDDYLDIWGTYEGLTRNAATGAYGYATLVGTAATVIPALTDFTGSNGYIYRTQAVATIAATSQVISSITRSSTTATATTAADHNLSSGMTVTISGATQAEYNGAVVVTVTGRDTFTYTVSGTPATPATGSPVLAINIAVLDVECTTTGADTNLTAGAQIVNATYGTAQAVYDGIGGGAAIEDDEDFRARILLSRSTLEGVFTSDQIKLAALSISGNTRVFVKRATYDGAGGYLDPEPGEVSVFVLRDNDANIAPSAAVLAATKAAIIADAGMPATTAEADVYVNAPTLVESDFVFSAISPDTPTMQTAIQNSLQAFFDDMAEFETDITEASYLGAIQNTQDLETGAYLSTFTLSSPSTDISVDDGEIAVLGDVTFS